LVQRLLLVKWLNRSLWKGILIYLPLRVVQLLRRTRHRHAHNWTSRVKVDPGLMHVVHHLLVNISYLPRCLCLLLLLLKQQAHISGVLLFDFLELDRVAGCEIHERYVSPLIARVIVSIAPNACWGSVRCDVIVVGLILEVVGGCVMEPTGVVGLKHVREGVVLVRHVHKRCLCVH
jgi:hypothetical protein